MKNENALQTKSLVWLRGLDGEWENRSPGYFGSVGVPDIAGTLFGRSIFIELKNPNEHGPKATDTRWPLQDRWLQKYANAGGFTIGTNSFDFLQICVMDIVRGARTDNGVCTLAPFYRIYWK